MTAPRVSVCLALSFALHLHIAAPSENAENVKIHSIRPLILRGGKKGALSGIDNDIRDLCCPTPMYDSIRGGYEAVDNDAGRIEMIIGPMFAGKSTELMRRIRRHNLACRRFVMTAWNVFSRLVHAAVTLCIQVHSPEVY